MSDTIQVLADIPRLNAAAADATRSPCSARTARSATRELNGNAERAAALLVALAVQPGQRVAWLGRSHELFFELLFGAALARACLAPINSRLAIPEIAFILDDSSAELFFVTQDFFAAAEAVVAQISRPIRLIAIDGVRPGFEDYAALRDTAPSTPAAHAAGRRRRAAALHLRHHRSAQGSAALQRQHGRVP